MADCHLSVGNCSPSLINLYYEKNFGPLLNANSATTTKIIMHTLRKFISFSISEYSKSISTVTEKFLEAKYCASTYKASIITTE